MLQNMRESMSGPVAFFIVGLIAVPFAFWGLDQFNTGGGDPTLAKVGDTKITQSQFQRGYQQRYQQLVSLMGENFRADLIDQQRFQNTVLQDMIDESLLRQFVEDRGYRVSDGELFEFIKSIPSFQQDGKFNTETYRSALARQGSTPAQFEQRVRDSLEIEQMRTGVIGSAVVTESDLALSYRLRNQQRFLSHVSFKAQAYQDQVEISDDDVADYYDRNRAQFTAPERIKLAYVELDLESLPKAESPSADVLRTIYDAERNNRFTTPEERLARHVLIKFGADKAAAKSKAEGLAKQLADGASFADLAKEHSEDSGSKDDGGSLVWVRRGQMVDGFEQALFDLDEGQVSGVVETEFGFHLIKLEELRAGQVQAFEDEAVQQQLLALYERRDNERRFQELSDQLEQIAFESPDSLEPVSEALDLKVQQTGWFTRGGGAGIAADSQVKEASFSAEVLAGENSRPLRLSATRTLVIRKQEYEAARQRALDEVAESVRNRLRTERARAAAKADADAALARVQGGEALEAVAKDLGLELTSTGLIEQSNREVDPAIVRKLFTMPRPGEGNSSFAIAATADGGAAVLALSAVQDGQVADADEATRATEQQRLRDALAGAEFTAYRGAIRDQLSVKLLQQPGSDPES